MPKCPNREEEIDHLIQAQSGVMESYFDGHTYEEIEFYQEEKTKYVCPECKESIRILYAQEVE